MDVRIAYFFAVLGIVYGKFGCSSIKKIVDGHNSRRLLLAEGKVKNQPPARFMKTIVWDERLAAKAEAWASNNKFVHNPNKGIDSPDFSSTGENLYQYSTTAKHPSFDPEVALEAWFVEHEDYTYKPLESSDMHTSRPIGHYTQMVWSDSTHVGCGLSKFKEGSWTNFLFVCNYGPAGNYISETPYDKGAAIGHLHCSGSGNCAQKYGSTCYQK